MTTDTINTRLVMLESRILALESMVKRIQQNQQQLDGNDTSFLTMIKQTASALETNEKADEMLHEALLNRIKGVNMKLGKYLKRIQKLEKAMKTVKKDEIWEEMKATLKTLKK